MRNAYLTFPNQSNDGISFTKPEGRFGNLKARLEKSLVRAFGGFTATRADGAWHDVETDIVHAESVTVYKIAGDWSTENESKLRGIAARYCALGEQICVLVEFANGESEFISPEADLAATLGSARALLAA